MKESSEDKAITAIPLLDLKAGYGLIRDEILSVLDRVIESQSFILGKEGYCLR